MSNFLTISQLHSMRWGCVVLFCCWLWQNFYLGIYFGGGTPSTHTHAGLVKDQTFPIFSYEGFPSSWNNFAWAKIISITILGNFKERAILQQTNQCSKKLTDKVIDNKGFKWQSLPRSQHKWFTLLYDPVWGAITKN